MNFWYSSGSNSTALRPILRQPFVPLLFFENLYVHHAEPFLVILCDTLFRRSKLIFFTFESAETYWFLYIKDAPCSRKILLKLIHFKSRNSGVTWSRFKYFPLLATFAAKLIHFGHSCPISYATLWAWFKCYPTTSQHVNQAIFVLLFANCIL